MEIKEMTMAEELQQLRDQYSSLKEELNRRNSINEKFILSSIKKDLHTVNGKKWIGLFGCLMAVPLIVMLSIDWGFRLPFVIISVIWLLTMQIGNWLRNKDVDIDSLSSETVQSFVAEMKRRKKAHLKCFRINFSCLIIWIGCLIGECFHSGMDKEMLVPCLCGICVGLVLGLIVAFRMHNKVIGTYEDIILQLENPDAV